MKVLAFFYFALSLYTATGAREGIWGLSSPATDTAGSTKSLSVNNPRLTVLATSNGDEILRVFSTTDSCWRASYVEVGGRKCYIFENVCAGRSSIVHPVCADSKESAPGSRHWRLRGSASTMRTRTTTLTSTAANTDDKEATLDSERKGKAQSPDNNDRDVNEPLLVEEIPSDETISNSTINDLIKQGVLGTTLSYESSNKTAMSNPPGARSIDNKESTRTVKKFVVDGQTLLEYGLSLALELAFICHLEIFKEICNRNRSDPQLTFVIHAIFNLLLSFVPLILFPTNILVTLWCCSYFTGMLTILVTFGIESLYMRQRLSSEKFNKFVHKFKYWCNAWMILVAIGYCKVFGFLQFLASFWLPYLKSLSGYSGEG